MGSVISKIYDDYDDYEEMCRLVGKKPISLVGTHVEGSFYNDRDNMLKEAEVDNVYDFFAKMKNPNENI